MVLLVVAMVGVTFVITDVLFGSAAAAVATAAVSGFFVYVWVLTPIWYRPNATWPRRKPARKRYGVRSQELVLSWSALHHG